MNQKNNTFYRFGERPVIGGEYCAFRDFDSLCGFLKMTGEANLVTFKSNNQNVIVKTDKNTDYEIDAVLKLNFNKEDCYFFDIKSEERLRI